jgi:hypothetical protein
VVGFLHLLHKKEALLTARLLEQLHQQLLTLAVVVVALMVALQMAALAAPVS